MMPWEKYAAQAAPEGAPAIPPWEKYKQQAEPTVSEQPQSMAGFVGGNLAKGAAQVAGIPAEVGKQLLSATEGSGRERFEKLTKVPALSKSTRPMVGSQEH